jgi:hypothetical protein
MNHKFDKLAKSLAQSVSRRAALRKFGVGLAGTALACFGLASGYLAAGVELVPAANPSNIMLELDRLYYHPGDPVFATLKFPSDQFIAPGTNELYVFITSMGTKDVETIRLTYNPQEPLVWRSAPLATTTNSGALMDGALNVLPGDQIAAVWYPYALGPGAHVEENLIGDVGIILGPHPGADLITVNTDLALTVDELTPEPGDKPRGTLLPSNGIPVQIALNEMILIPRDASQLQEFLSQTGGSIVMSNLPPGLAATESATSYLIQVDPDLGSLEALPHLRALLGQTGAVVASNEKALRFWSLCLEYQLQGFVVAANPAMQFFGVPSAGLGEMNNTMRAAGPLNVPQLWAFLALWDFDSAHIPVAVLDSGFAPSPDLRVPILECDVDGGFVIGPGRAMGPQRVGSSLFGDLVWHGTGVASILGGLLNNSWPSGSSTLTGRAGVGGQVVDPMLYYYGLRSFAFEFGVGIRHAAASGASAINISAGYPCTIVSRLGIGFDICSPGGRAAFCAVATAPLAAASSQICAAAGAVAAIPIIGPILAIPLTIACSVAVSATATASTACFATIALGDPPDPMQTAIDFANARGVPIVSVAGNKLDPASLPFPPEVLAIINFGNIDPSAWMIVPGTLRGVICAASADNDWPFANEDFSGSRVDLWAPVLTEYLRPVPQNTMTPASTWMTFDLDGTSAAAPYICGVIAAMQAVNPALNPNTPSLSPAQRAAIPATILSILTSTAWNAATLNIMAPSGQQAATIAAGAARRNLINPFGAILSAANGVLPNFSAMGYDSRLNFNETDDVAAADLPSFARTLAPGVETSGTIICIPGLTSSLGIPAVPPLLPSPPNADVDWWKIQLPSAGTLVQIRVVLTYPTGFGELVIDSSSLQRVSRTVSGLETRDTYETIVNLKSGTSPLAFRLAGIPSGNASINLVTDNVYKLLLNSVEVLDAPEAKFCADFNSGVPPGMTLFGDARVDAGRLKLETVGQPNSFGIAYLDDFGDGRFVQTFRATFKADLFGSTTYPADGFSFNLVPATSVRANPGYGQPAEEGLDEGLAVNFDTFDNGGGEAPAVEIKWLGKIIASTPFQASQSSGTNPATLSDVVIELKVDGKMDVSYGGTVLFADVATPYDPAAIRAPKWVLGARVGSGNDNYWFDDLCIDTLAAPGRQIPDIYNTGVNSVGVPLAEDAVDPHYRLNGSTDVYVATEDNGFPIPPWMGNNGLSAWISPTLDTWALADGLGTFNYRYEMTFDLTGFDPATARVAGRWATDNQGIDILLNGASKALVNTAGYGAWTPFQITGGFGAGLNRLAFIVNNGAPGMPQQLDPTGLRVEIWGMASLSCPFTGAPPPLSYSFLSEALVLSWGQPGFVLQAAPTLGGPYIDLTRGVTVNGRDFTHTVPANGSMAFFRLRRDCN